MSGSPDDAAASGTGRRQGPETGSEPDPVLSAHLVLDDGVVEIGVERGGACLVTLAAVAALLGEDGGDEHRIILADRRLDGLDPAARVRAGLVAVRADAPVAPEVSVRDHLGAVAPLRRVAAVLEEAPLLAGRGGLPAGVLSGGERRVLAWLRARLLDPVALVLDGAATGADEATLAWMAHEVVTHRRGGVAVLVRAGRPEERAWVTAGRRMTE